MLTLTIYLEDFEKEDDPRMATDPISESQNIILSDVWLLFFELRKRERLGVEIFIKETERRYAAIKSFLF